jgi:RNA polymerase sigma-70 factor (ECF subfamily)
MLFRKRHGQDPDARLVELAGQGVESAFEELLHRHQGAVFRFAARFLGDREEAADIAQETFLRLYRNAAAYRPEAALRTYLFRIARNLCLDLVRRKRPVLMAELPEQPTGDHPYEALVGAEHVEALSRALAELPETQRSALLLRHDEGLAYAEIAEAMNTTVPAVESLLVRARKTLRSCLDGRA